MSTPPDEPKTHTNRRSVKRFKRSGSHQPLNHQASFSISQLLRSKATAQAPLDTYPVSLTIGAYQDAPLKGRMHTSYVFPSMGTRGSLDDICIYTYHPSNRLDLQSLLALVSSNTDSPPTSSITTISKAFSPTTQPPAAPSSFTFHSPTPTHKTYSTSTCSS